MAAKRTTPKIKKYKSIQTATNARRVTGSAISRKASTAVSRANKTRGKGSAGTWYGLSPNSGSLTDVVIRTIKGMKVPINQGGNSKKKKK